MNETLAILLVVFFAAICLVFFAILLSTIRSLRKEISRLEKRMSKLDAALAAQRTRVDRMAELAAEQGLSSPFDALPEVAGALSQVPQRGWVPALSLVGGKLLAAYWKQRRSKA